MCSSASDCNAGSSEVLDLGAGATTRFGQRRANSNGQSKVFNEDQAKAEEEAVAKRSAKEVAQKAVPNSCYASPRWREDLQELCVGTEGGEKICSRSSRRSSTKGCEDQQSQNPQRACMVPVEGWYKFTGNATHSCMLKEYQDIQEFNRGGMNATVYFKAAKGTTCVTHDENTSCAVKKELFECLVWRPGPGIFIPKKKISQNHGSHVWELEGIKLAKKRAVECFDEKAVMESLLNWL